MACLVLLLLGLFGAAATGQSVAGAATKPAVRAAKAAAAVAKTPFPATGYFSVAQNDGRWWLVTPQGEPFYAAGIDTVSPVGDTDEVTGLCLYCEAVASQYPNDPDHSQWATATLAQLRSWGFNTLGDFSDTSVLGSQMPYEVQLTMAGTSDEDWYSPSFVTQADQVAAAQVAPLANDPNVIGYFTDDELNWGPPDAGVLLDQYLALPAGSPGLAVAEQYVGDPNGFLYAVATRYFQVTTAAIRMYDTHHLILGVKAEGQEIQSQLLQAATPYVDVFSLEDYTLQPGFDQIIDEIWPQMLPDTPNLADMEQYAQRPLMIGEYAAIATSPADPNTHPGIYAVSPDQQARANAYENFIAPLYQDAPWVVGDDWFEYYDEPQGGRPGDNENNDFGMVNVEDQPYPTMESAMELMHSIMAPNRLKQTGPVCDSWANGPSGVTCNAYIPQASYPVTIVTDSLASGTQGTSYANTVYADANTVYAGGGTTRYSASTPGYKFALSQGSLPKGLKLNRTTGIISGTPKAAGTSGFTVQVTDSAGSQATQPLSIYVAPDIPVAIKTASLRTAHENVTYAETLAASGGTGPYTWAITAGALPSGLSLGTSGQISGQPSVSGSFQFTIQATDSTTPAETATRNFSLVVEAPR
jgi:hypothetical protein